MLSQNAIPLAQKALDSTVLLVTKDANDKLLSFGSGFFVSNNLIVTNLHVVHGAMNCFAKLFGQERMYEIEGYTAIDPENDLIILKIKDINESVLPLNLGNSVSVHIGETIYAVGNPKGYEGTVSNGIISGIREADKLIQMTAPISRGSSGGPVINSKGEVIGVSVLSRTDGQNLNFAIPSIYVEKLIEKAEECASKSLLYAKLAGVTWVNEELTWLQSENLWNSYQFFLLNQRRTTIRKIHCLVFFRDNRNELIHLDFLEFSGEISVGEKQLIVRSSIFDILSGEQIEDFNVNDIVFAATVFGSWGMDLSDRSLITPEIKQLAKTYEVRVVNFEVVE